MFYVKNDIEYNDSTMEQPIKKELVKSIREIVFGLEDSLVSTLGTLTGIAVGAQNTYIVILAGFVLIAAESTSMAAGSYLSSKSAFAAEQTLHHRRIRAVQSIRAAMVMWISYLIGGFIPLAPYLFLPISHALILSIVFTVFSLFFVGVWAGKMTGRSKIQNGLEMLTVSLLAALIGYLIGQIVHRYFQVL